MHPIVKGAIIAFQTIKTIDEMSDGKLRKQGGLAIKKILEKKVKK